MARNVVCAQAFRAGCSLGVQFHPEITTAMVHGRIETGGVQQCVRHAWTPASC
ncbi:hypothetical protein [Streptomyces canus]|uniref:hypothetical protein n=1 Tax=Streptomyces canus TaxID=58343 RepID=UPI0036E0AA4F